jgi:hypothetical protein
MTCKCCLELCYCDCLDTGKYCGCCGFCDYIKEIENASTTNDKGVEIS